MQQVAEKSIYSNKEGRIRLEAIYYCIDGEAFEPLIQQLEEEEGTERFKRTDIPKAKLPKIEEGHTLPRLWQSEDPSIASLAERLQYRLSNGEVCSAREIFQTKAAREVSPRLLASSHRPIQPQPRFPFRLLDSVTSQGTEAQRWLEWSLLTVLLHAEPMPVFLVLGTKRTKKRVGFKLSEVRTSKQWGGTWGICRGSWLKAQVPKTSPLYTRPEVGKTAFAFALDENQASTSDLISTACFHIDKSSGALVFHPAQDQFIRTRDILVQAPGHVGTEQLSGGGLILWTEGHRNIRSVLKELEEKNQIKIERDAFTIDEDAVQAECWVEPEGVFRFARSIYIQDEVVRIWNLPLLFDVLFAGLRNGLGSAMDQPTFKAFHPHEITLKSDRDWKFLRHGGIFGLLIYESFKVLQKEKTGESENIKDLIDSLASLFVQLEKRAGFVELAPNTPLERLCSNQVISSIETFVRFLRHQVEHATESFFVRGKEYRIQGGASCSLRLLSQTMAFIGEKSQGQCFLRPRFPWTGTSTVEDTDLEHWVETHPKTEEPMSANRQAHAYVTTASVWTSLDLLLALTPHKAYWKLFFRDKPAKLVEAREIKPSLEVRDAPHPTPQLLPDFGGDQDPSPTQVSNGTHDLNWFELNPRFFLNDTELPPEVLKHMAEHGWIEHESSILLIPQQHLPSIQRLQQFWEQIQSLSKTGVKTEKGRSYFPLPRSQTLELLALRATGIDVRGGKRWQSIVEFYEGLNQPKREAPSPAGLKGQLKDYQKHGLRWILDLYHLGLGGILADDMGLGKTIQTLAFLETLRESHQMGHVLIVVPTSLTYNWMMESERFTPEIPVHLFQGRSCDALQAFMKVHSQCIVVVTYGLFTEHQAVLETMSWRIHIFDEAQSLKNMTAKRTTASRKIPARFKLCLTGTPLENHLGEFYSLMDLVVPGCLGEFPKFKERYLRPATIEPKDLKILRLKSKPLVLRRTKSQILSELPPKVESTIKLPFETKQEKIYRDIAVSWNKRVKEALSHSSPQQETQLLMLTALLRLRQACSDPAGIPNIKYATTPPKVETLIESLEEITDSGQSALVFTQFLTTFKRIEDCLRAAKIPFFSMHGATSRVERERVLSDFQSSNKGSVLLMTLKTGGVGLNLVKATYVFHLEPWWNPAVENQATDRVHRIGQQQAVQVYRYLMKESVEEKIELLKARKSAQFNAMFSNSEEIESGAASGSKLTQEDFEYLLLS